ncbi:PEPxxWA-CTERM sorting domain-containing protein [Phenylobacterium sp.]|uniref:PEPxxWA-CTERM sorting domain-containing protein n=1 Tax=Phenylobacterium sp. TaxID=1871053 RepID=UPI003BA99526
MLKKLAFALVAVALSLSAAPARAALLIYNGISNAYILTLVEGIELAGAFTLAEETTVTQVEGFVFPIHSTGTFTIKLTESRGLTPGDTLFSGEAEATTRTPAFRGLSGLNWVLGPGTYWVTFSVKPGQTFSGGMPGPSNSLEHEAFKSNFTGQNWVNSDGRLGIGVRIYDNLPDPIAVPEPATWALVLSGFGAAGVALRRRRAAVASAR